MPKEKVTEIFDYRAPDSGKAYQWGSATVTVKLSPNDSVFTYMSSWTVSLPTQSSVDFHAARAVDRIYYCTAGDGQATLNGKAQAISRGSYVYCGRGVQCQFENTANDKLTLTACSIPGSPEVSAALSSGAVDVDKASDEALACLGLVRSASGVELPDDLIGGACVVGENEGISYWQPAPSLGHVTGKTPIDIILAGGVGAAVQLLTPGSHVVEHAHKRGYEMLMAVSGEGTVTVNGEELPFTPGSVAIVGPRVYHTFRNASETEDFQVLACTTLTEQGEALLELGVPRIPGDAPPEEIVRDLTTAKRMIDNYGFLIAGISDQ